MRVLEDFESEFNIELALVVFDLSFLVVIERALVVCVSGTKYQKMKNDKM